MSESTKPIEPPKQLSRKTIRILQLIALILLLITVIYSGGLFLSTISVNFFATKRSRAKAQINTLIMALANYQTDFGALPPAESEVPFETYLYRQIKLSSGATCGPYIVNSTGMMSSPWGFRRYYIVRLDAAGKPEALIIDPGPDGLLGGSIDANGHFIPDGSDVNKDGVRDDQDNLYSLPNP